MNDEDEEHDLPAQGFQRTANDSLESAASYLATSESTGDPGHGSREKFRASFDALLSWGEHHKFIKLEEDFPFLAEPPTAAGHEHEAWFDEKSNRWFKATYSNRFGFAWGREGSATPKEYLDRLLLQNKCFGDDLRLESLINSNGKLRVLTSQPHIQGDAAAAEIIRKWFELLGFERLESDGSIAWYDPHFNLLVADAHEGNVILTDEGYLVPIDLNIMEPSEAMREEIRRMFRAT